MSQIYFLNVNEGDCTWIQHDSGRNTVIDICNGNAPYRIQAVVEKYQNFNEANYRMKSSPTNPIQFFEEHGMKRIFRFILTHPDMDHMDGIEKLFRKFSPANFWDTDNNAQKDTDENWKGKYKKEDWEFYQKKHKEKRSNHLMLLAGAKGPFYNDGDDNDGLDILAPTKELVESANKTRQYNILSYVLLLEEWGRKIVFSGDSEKQTWDKILARESERLENVDILVAPHHGRKSGGNDEYLKVLNPKLSLLGNAKSQFLDYSSFNNRELRHYTNNEAGNIILNINADGISIYLENAQFAKEEAEKSGVTCCYDKRKGGWLARIISQ